MRLVAQPLLDLAALGLERLELAAIARGGLRPRARGAGTGSPARGSWRIWASLSFMPGSPLHGAVAVCAAREGWAAPRIRIAVRRSRSACVQRHRRGVEVAGRRRLVLEIAEAVLRRAPASRCRRRPAGGPAAAGSGSRSRGGGRRRGSWREPWKILTWCSDIWPGCSTRSTAWSSSTSTAISWPRESMFCAPKVSWCGTTSRWCVPGTTRMQPLSGVRRRERHPGGDHVALLVEAPVGDVLVPADVVLGLRLLVEEDRFPAQDVGPDHRLDRIEDRRLADQLLRPGVDQVRLVPVGAGQAAAGGGLGRLELRCDSARPRPGVSTVSGQR